MNNNIQEDYCSFEVSKLLKEKGYTIQQYSYYTSTGELGFNYNNYYGDLSGYFHAPTHAFAIKWIRENFGIHIRTDRQPIEKNKFVYFYEIKSGDGFDTEPIYSGTFNLIEEATEAALKYTLQKLIA